MCVCVFVDGGVGGGGRRLETFINVGFNFGECGGSYHENCFIAVRENTSCHVFFILKPYYGPGE